MWFLSSPFITESGQQQHVYGAGAMVDLPHTDANDNQGFQQQQHGVYYQQFYPQRSSGQPHRQALLQQKSGQYQGKIFFFA